MDDKLEKLRGETVRFAVSEVRRVRRGYQEFARRDAPEEFKEFGAFHTACKTALGHMEALLKMARWASEEAAQQEANPNSDLADLLREARGAVGPASDETRP